ncbi:dihydroorotase [Achromobacter ruhlandii]|uniref:dihydroorotase n=1 Tax=Achromobacter ruhlandii TaxID=72557 RepID=UPI0006C4F6BD|nr:dihydroorotase [Achromobacter ruhlandii]AMG43771.1 dihydroorotase [Achromobacter xylosoxidans]CUJ55321.1 Dihydroorotase [Achromobacter ruhlandii]CUJ70547.1 Dihydroorotase [Achromobacter ruhlandii]CUK23485.1 Dihydroorotase [Achromobacter ruhlandii]
MRLHIAHGRLIDPAHGRDGHHDLFIADGRVVAIDQAPDGFQADRRIEAAGLAVLPGLVDLSARVLRPDAGAPTQARLSAAELRAALAGGVTTLAVPPDTDTRLDEPAKVEALLREAPPGQGRVLPIGALTVGLRGATLAEMALLAQAGCLAFSPGESGIVDTRVLWGAMRYAAGQGLALWLRPQDPWLGQGAVVAAGAYADRLGLEGLPPQAEVLALQTIFELQRATGVRVHLSRLSTASGLELLRAARREGLPVSADVSANSLHLTDVDIGYFNTAFHLRPPLRGQRDRDAIQAALREGLVDALCSDHALVDDAGKSVPFPHSQPGATGLELLLSLALKWARDSRLPLPQALARVTSGPATVLRGLSPTLSGLGELGVGAPADLCLVDLEAEWLVAPGALQSHSRHTPFAGMMLPGRVRATLVGGRPAWETPV